MHGKIPKGAPATWLMVAIFSAAGCREEYHPPRVPTDSPVLYQAGSAAFDTASLREQDAVIQWTGSSPPIFWLGLALYVVGAYMVRRVQGAGAKAIGLSLLTLGGLMFLSQVGGFAGLTIHTPKWYGVVLVLAGAFAWWVTKQVPIPWELDDRAFFASVVLAFVLALACRGFGATPSFWLICVTAILIADTIWSNQWWVERTEARTALLLVFVLGLTFVA